MAAAIHADLDSGFTESDRDAIARHRVAPNGNRLIALQNRVVLKHFMQQGCGICRARRRRKHPEADQIPGEEVRFHE